MYHGFSIQSNFHRLQRRMRDRTKITRDSPNSTFSQKDSLGKENAIPGTVSQANPSTATTMHSPPAKAQKHSQEFPFASCPPTHPPPDRRQGQKRNLPSSSRKRKIRCEKRLRQTQDNDAAEQAAVFLGTAFPSFFKFRLQDFFVFCHRTSPPLPFNHLSSFMIPQV